MPWLSVKEVGPFNTATVGKLASLVGVQAVVRQPYLDPIRQQGTSISPTRWPLTSYKWSYGARIKWPYK